MPSSNSYLYGVDVTATDSHEHQRLLLSSAWLTSIMLAQAATVPPVAGWEVEGRSDSTSVSSKVPVGDHDVTVPVWGGRSYNTVGVGQTPKEPTWVAKAFRRLKLLPTTESDEDIPRPNATAVLAAQQVLEHLANVDWRPPRIIDSEEGGLTFEFVVGDRYADISCYNSGEVLAATAARGAPTNVWPVSLAGGEPGLKETVDRIIAYMS